jgi:hypothetical protein
VISKELTVPSTMDATDPDISLPVTVKRKGSGGMFWWKSGYFDIQIDIPRGGYTSEEHVPIKISIQNHSDYGLWIKSIKLKQRVNYITVDRYFILIRSRGPRTEKIHKLAYSEFVPFQLRDIVRSIQFPIPKIHIMDPDIDTKILRVTHCIHVEIQSAATYSRPVKVQVPLIITGFPHLLFEDSFLRRSVDTLPIYAQSDLTEPETTSEVAETDSEMDFGLAVPFQFEQGDIRLGIPSVTNAAVDVDQTECLLDQSTSPCDPNSVTKEPIWQFQKVDSIGHKLSESSISFDDDQITAPQRKNDKEKDVSCQTNTAKLLTNSSHSLTYSSETSSIITAQNKSHSDLLNSLSL